MVEQTIFWLKTGEHKYVLSHVSIYKPSIPTRLLEAQQQTQTRQWTLHCSWLLDLTICLYKPKKIEFQHEELRNPKWRHSARQGQVLHVYTEPRYLQIMILFFRPPKNSIDQSRNCTHDKVSTGKHLHRKWTWLAAIFLEISQPAPLETDLFLNVLKSCLKRGVLLSAKNVVGKKQ